MNKKLISAIPLVFLSAASIAGRPAPSIPAGVQTYRIMSPGGRSPRIVEAVINPLDVKVGDRQEMRVMVQDARPVQSVRAEVSTDTGIKTFRLSRVAGTDTDGEWRAAWKVSDTHSKTYSTTFIAVNAASQTDSVTLSWTDPCSPPAGGDWTLDGNCSFSGANGVDNGNVILNNVSYTLTVEAGAAFAWNSGKEITLTAGTVAINTTGEMKQTNLWMIDADADGYPATTVQYAQDSAPVNGRRRNLMSTISSVDCNDSNNLVGITPSPPSISASAPSMTLGIDVSWGAVSGATGYRLYRSSENVDYFLIASPVSTSYSDTTGLSWNTVYYYKALSYLTGCSDSAFSNVASAQTTNNLTYAAGHTRTQCTSAGGTISDCTTGTCCRFYTTGCPGGWTAASCWGSTLASCTSQQCNCTNGSCCVGGHTWSNDCSSGGCCMKDVNGCEPSCNTYVCVSVAANPVESVGCY